MLVALFFIVLLSGGEIVGHVTRVNQRILQISRGFLGICGVSGRTRRVGVLF